MSTNEGKVVLGASVTLRTEPEGETVRYRIVEAKEADIPNGKLSVSAPLARGLVGHEENELITVEAPGGARIYRIMEIRRGE